MSREGVRGRLVLEVFEIDNILQIRSQLLNEKSMKNRKGKFSFSEVKVFDIPQAVACHEPTWLRK